MRRIKTPDAKKKKDDYNRMTLRCVPTLKNSHDLCVVSGGKGREGGSGKGRNGKEEYGKEVKEKRRLWEGKEGGQRKNKE